MILLRAGDMQVFTDETGDAFGAGPGAVVAATFANASGVDPLVERVRSWSMHVGRVRQESHLGTRQC